MKILIQTDLEGVAGVVSFDRQAYADEPEKSRAMSLLTAEVSAAINGLLEADGSTLTMIDTEYGTVGGLICWENYMPLARAAMYDRGVDIYLAPTADSRDTWQATLRHIACEGRCFVLGCNQFVTKGAGARLRQDRASGTANGQR